MKIHNSIVDTIGRTPIVKLNNINRSIDATVAVKLEFFNPCGSIKDRTALEMIRTAERDGLLRPGGTIVEATSGNTGYAIAMLGAAKNYKVVIVCTDSLPFEKVSTLKAFGAKVVQVPADAPPDSPLHYLNTAKCIAKENSNTFFANQSFNPANPLAHYQSTGPEIWEQTDGKITTFVCAAGTGGTISGTAKYLKEMNSSIEIVMADPYGSLYKDYFETGQIGEPLPYLVEAAGQNEKFIPGCFDPSFIDRAVLVKDEDSFLMAKRLAMEEGIFCGISSGMIVHAAIEVAKKKTKDDLIVAIVCDSADKYLSRLYSKEWLEINLPELENKLLNLESNINFENPKTS